MPCRELRFVLSVVFYVVNENLQNRIRSKSCKKQKKTPETVGFQVLFWSCWADSNRRPHPYQEIFDNFYNNLYLFLVIFVPNNVVSRTFEKCSLRCFHICLWWNCGQAAILRIRPLIVKLALRNLGYKVRNHIRCISISYSPDFFTLYTAFFSQYIIECL